MARFSSQRLTLPRMGLLCSLGTVMLATLLLSGCPRVPADKRPEASFTGQPRAGTVPLTVTFSDTSTFKGAPIQSWLWNFGDGIYSSTPNAVHTYTQAGNYTVSLTVTSADGVDTKLIANYVQATDLSAYATIGAGGGSVTATGAVLNVPQGALQGDQVFGVGQDSTPFQPNAFEAISVLSPAYRVTHSGGGDAVFAPGEGGGLVPATLEIRFEPQSIPAADRNGNHLQILAQLPDGVTLPLPGKLEGDRLRANLLHLPPSARYAVVYRAQAFSVDVVDGKVVTDGNWAGGWRVYLSNELLQQLTGLRVGTLQNVVPYFRRNFTALETQETLSQLLAGIGEIQARLGANGMRPPVLVNSDGRFNLMLYNFFALYPADYEDFQDLKYRDNTFGNLVVDPRQLIQIAQHNSAALQADPEQIDLAQELGPGNAFWQGVLDASIEGYGYPRIEAQEVGGTNPPVNFIDAIAQGLATMQGQVADGLPTSRSFGANEYALLSEPLLTPFVPGIPGYAVSGQDFFIYFNNRFNLNGSLRPIATRTTDPAGILEEVRKEFEGAPQGTPPTLDDALGRVYQAMDRSLNAQVGTKLSTTYWIYARDLGVEHSADAQLRPSDAAFAPNTLNEAAFGNGGIIVHPMDAPTDSAELGLLDPALNDIPPLTSRAVLFELRPMTTELTLTFNRADWVADANGDSIKVKVYKAGSAGTELSTTRDSITLRNFTEDPEDCYAKVIVLISNVSLDKTNSVEISAQSFSGLTGSESTVLDTYVQACDPDYAWSVESTQRVAAAGVTVSTLKMTTGAWRGLGEVDQTKWEHYLTVIEPDVVASNTAMLTINGGSTGNDPGLPPTEFIPFAVTAKTVVALLYAVPNEPITFAGETTGRVEDEIIAKSYGEYLDSHEENRTDATWPALLPMTRSAVRAMDTVQEFMAEEGRVPRTIEDFVVAGASKRGWTTWLTAAADTRVRAIMPLVIDVLNMDEQMQHHFKSYGFYAPAIQDYVAENVFDRLGTAAGASLLKIVDPISYATRLTMPKMIANSTGDQFFLPDSSQFYFDQLPGQNYLYYAPNTDHGLGANVDGLDSGTSSALLAWYLSIITDTPRPVYNWNYDDANTTSVTTNTVPIAVKLWQATNATARDFRLETIGPRWTSTDITPDELGRFVGQVSTPAKGWTGYFVQLAWPNPTNPELPPFSFSTPVRVVPDVYPAVEEGK